MQTRILISVPENEPVCVSLGASDCGRCGIFIHDVIPWRDQHPRPPLDDICSNKSTGRETGYLDLIYILTTGVTK